jgi:hypothetical protein
MTYMTIVTQYGQIRVRKNGVSAVLDEAVGYKRVKNSGSLDQMPLL